MSVRGSRSQMPVGLPRVGFALAWVGGSIFVHVAVLGVGVIAYRSWGHSNTSLERHVRKRRAHLEQALPVELAVASSVSKHGARLPWPDGDRLSVGRRQTSILRRSVPRQIHCDPSCVTTRLPRPKLHRVEQRSGIHRRRLVARSVRRHRASSSERRLTSRTECSILVASRTAPNSTRSAQASHSLAVVSSSSVANESVQVHASRSVTAVSGRRSVQDAVRSAGSGSSAPRSRRRAPRRCAGSCHESTNRGPDGAAVAARIHALVQRQVVYPLQARRMGIEGRVVLLFRIRTGRALSIQVVSSAGAILNRAAIEALHRAEPLPQYGGRVRVPVRFRLDR